MTKDATLRDRIGRALFEHRTLPGTRWDSDDAKVIREFALYDADIVLRTVDFGKCERQLREARVLLARVAVAAERDGVGVAMGRVLPDVLGADS